MKTSKATPVWQLLKECQRTNINPQKPLDMENVFRLVKTIQDGHMKDERNRLVREIQESFK